MRLSHSPTIRRSPTLRRPLHPIPNFQAVWELKVSPQILGLDSHVVPARVAKKARRRAEPWMGLHLTLRLVMIYSLTR